MNDNISNPELLQLLNESFQRLEKLSAETQELQPDPADEPEPVRQPEPEAEAVPQTRPEAISEPETADYPEDIIPEEDTPPSANNVDPNVYDKMVEELEKRRRRKKSIWTDEPVVPVRKSIWLDDDENGYEDNSGQTQTAAPPIGEAAPTVNAAASAEANASANTGTKRSFLMKLTPGHRSGKAVKAVNITQLSDSDKPVEVRKIRILPHSKQETPEPSAPDSRSRQYSKTVPHRKG